MHLHTQWSIKKARLFYSNFGKCGLSLNYLCNQRWTVEAGGNNLPPRLQSVSALYCKIQTFDSSLQLFLHISQNRRINYEVFLFDRCLFLAYLFFWVQCKYFCDNACWLLGTVLNKLPSTYLLTSGMHNSKHLCMLRTDILSSCWKLIYVNIRNRN